MRMRRKPNLEARIEKCSHLLVSEPHALRGGWLREPGHSELHLEIGCGKGRFTVEMAKTQPGVLFAALEKTANVLIIAMERADREGLSNVRYINALADYVPDYFAPGEVSRIYLNFPDPWPSGRHEKRRLTAQGYLELYSQILRPGGEIQLKTDDLPLFEFSLWEFERSGLMLLAEERDLHRNGPAGVMTDYEEKFHSQKIPIYKCTVSSRGTEV